MQHAVLIAAALLLIGFVLRWRLRVLAALYIPAAVVAGAIGLLLVQLAGRSERWSELAATVLPHWIDWRNVLVPVIFAGLLLDPPPKRGRRGGDGRAVTQQAIAAWIVILGQLALGLLVAWALLMPVFGVPVHFGQLLEVSWSGGFGSANAWGQQQERIGEFPAARDFANFFATAGLLWGVVSGVAIVNIGIRRGWTAAAPMELSTDIEATAVEAAHPASGILEPLTLQLIWLAGAFAVGVGMQWLVARAAATLEPGNTIRQALGQLPLFLFTLLGGWIVRRLLVLLRMDRLLDAALIGRIVGVALDVLILVAIATMSVQAIARHIPAAAILLIAGAAWTAFYVFWIAPRVLPRRCWFELAMLNYGFATATTAQGMMLLRMIDPKLRTDAPRIYALAAPATAMFIGGGVLTYVVPIVVSRGWTPGVIAASAVAALVLYLLGRRFQATENRSSSAFPPNRSGELPASSRN